jgi:NTP pyrophosphatase (non-canonical NTP hydrolase)
MNNEHARLQQQLRDFAREREWEKFHAPKNLAAALSVEAGELLEHFQWMTETESRSLSPEKCAVVAEELADVFLYLLMLSDRLQIDLVEAARSKVVSNERKYPVALAKGNSRKYTEL